MLQNPLIALHILPKINKISPKGQFFVKSGHTEQLVGKRKRERERERDRTVCYNFLLTQRLTCNCMVYRGKNLGAVV